MSNFQLARDAFGRLVFTSANGEEIHEGVMPVRAFPIAAPDDGLALVNREGRELAWIDTLADVPAETRRLLEDELAMLEFLPEIQRICHVSSTATPSTWHVLTNRGEISFVLKGEEDIRRIAHEGLLIADSHSIQFLIRDIRTLDKGSRKLLDRFL